MSETTKHANTALTDMPAFLKAQQGERYRAFIVHAQPNRGKTAFAKKLADVNQRAYIDVLAIIAGDAELAKQVDVLDAAFLKRLALDAAKQGADLVLVDEFDFLLPVWGGNLSELLEIVRKLSVAETQAIIGFVMQTVPALETLELKNSAGQSRVLRLDEIKGLK